MRRDSCSTGMALAADIPVAFARTQLSAFGSVFGGWESAHHRNSMCTSPQPHCSHLLHVEQRLALQRHARHQPSVHDDHTIGRQLRQEGRMHAFQVGGAKPLLL